MEIKNIVLSNLNKFSLVNKYYTGIATIFTLHRVSPSEPDKLFPNENLKVSPAFLKDFILKLKYSGYEIINLDRLAEILLNNENVKKQIVFTLDDGYLDNYTLAYPIFKEMNVPFTVYLTPSFPENKCILWWYILEELLLANDFIELSTGTFACKTLKEKNDVFLQIRKSIITLTQTNSFMGFETLFRKYKIDWYKTCIEKAMNWQQIIELSKDKLVTIGGHSMNHSLLNSLNDEQVIEEIVEGNKLIEKEINKPINHFSYPFGSKNEVNKREFDIIKKMNIKTAVTTRNGNIFHKHSAHLEALPRIMLTENFKITEIGSIKRKRIVIE